MYKFYQELKEPDKIAVNLVKNQAEDFKVPNRPIPISFFNKYKKLYDDLKKIIIDTTFLSVTKLKQEIEIKPLNDNHSVIDYFEEMDCLNYFQELKEELSKNLETLEPSVTSESYKLYQCHELLRMLEILAPNTYKYYKNTRKVLSSARDELKKMNTIANPFKNKNSKVILPNSWYLTNIGTLYNAGGKDCHKETNLEYPFQRVEECIYTSQEINMSKQLKKNRQEIAKNGFITRSDFIHYLNYKDQFATLDNYNSVLSFNDKSHDPVLIKLILGILDAEIALYTFFENMQQYTENPRYQLDYLKEITNNDLRDICIRCLSFSKLETSNYEQIDKDLNNYFTTSSITYFKDLYHYLQNGFDICLIPPIIINQEKKKLEILNLASPILDHFLEKEYEWYKNYQDKSHGKVYQKSKKGTYKKVYE